MKAKMRTKKIYTGFFLLLTVLIGTQLLAPVIAPHLDMRSLLAGAVAAVGLFLCFYLPDGRRKVIPFTLLAAAFVAGGFVSGWRRWLVGVLDYFKWLWRDTEPGALLPAENFEWAGVCLLGGVLIGIGLLLERFFLLKELSGFFLLCFMIYCLITEKEIHVVTVSLSIFFMLIVVVELGQENNKGNSKEGEKAGAGRIPGEFNNESGGGKKTTVYLLPFFLLYFIGLLIVPRKPEPYDWQFFKDIYQNIKTAAIIVAQNAEEVLFSGREGFGMAHTGFSGSGKLGNGVADRDREEMRLSLKQGMGMSVYLTGNVFDTFDGESWHESRVETADDHKMDLLETLYAIGRYDGVNIDNYLHAATVAITYTNLKTAYLFTPPKSLRFVFADRETEIIEQGGQWVFPKRKGYGTEYTVSYFQMNIRQPFFAEMLEQENRYRYGENSADYRTVLEPWVLEELPAGDFETALQKRGEEIRARYTQSPAASDAVVGLIATVTADGRTDYEKCKAIEQFLNGHGGVAFKYTTSPAAMPEGGQFPDFFLLESREGYCTYYATAFVLMVRELGIPARYVQGFCVADDNIGKEPISVRGNMAHAWPEVYFAGVGWIPFEPTPGFGTNRYQYWEPAWTYAEEETAAANSPSGPLVVETPPPAAVIPAVTVNEEKGPGFPYEPAAVISAVILAGALLAVFDVHKRRRHYARLSPEDKFKLLVSINLRILRACGYRMARGETLSELQERILAADDRFLLEFITGYEKMLYGRGVINRETVNEAAAERKALMNKIKESGKRHYYWVRFKLLGTGGVTYEYRVNIDKLC